MLLLGACNLSEHEGYSLTKTGLHYKLLAIGEHTSQPTYGDYVDLDMVWTSFEGDTLFVKRGTFYLDPNFEEFDKGSIREGLTMLSVGDSASFIMTKEKAFAGAEPPKDFPDVEEIIANVKLQKVTPAEYYRERMTLNENSDADLMEMKQIKDYLESNELDVEKSPDGVIILEQDTGKGKSLAKGMSVIVHYEGWFLNGKKFDSTYDRGEFFEFILGQEGQLITGLEDMVKKLNVGGSAKVILPSYLAFGPQGSSTGIVPPYTPVMYTIEVLKAN